MVGPRYRNPSGSIPVRLTVLLGAALVIALALPTRADGPEHGSEWRMIGHDVANTRSQPLESRINPRNVSRLLPKWVLTTAGDVSATPAVVEDHDDHDRHATAAAGNATAIAPARCSSRTGAASSGRSTAKPASVLWSRSISEYNGIPNSISRTSPAYARGMIFVGDLNGNMMAVDAATGDLVWITELDPNPNTIVTTSPVVLGNRLYIATSSSGGGAARQIFRGSMIALDIRTGKIVWQTFVLPDNGGMPGGFAGGAFVNPPAIDVENGLVYGAAGQLYTQPAARLCAGHEHEDVVGRGLRVLDGHVEVTVVVEDAGVEQFVLEVLLPRARSSSSGPRTDTPAANICRGTSGEFVGVE